MLNPNSLERKLARSDEIMAVLADPAASLWLKQSIRSALQRDCVDAACDAELLARLLLERSAAILASTTPA